VTVQTQNEDDMKINLIFNSDKHVSEKAVQRLHCAYLDPNIRTGVIGHLNLIL